MNLFQTPEYLKSTRVEIETHEQLIDIMQTHGPYLDGSVEAHFDEDENEGYSTALVAGQLLLNSVNVDPPHYFVTFYPESECIDSFGYLDFTFHDVERGAIINQSFLDERNVQVKPRRKGVPLVQTILGQPIE